MKLREMCASHWRQWRKGYPLATLTRAALTTEERFWAKVDKENGPVHPIHGKCWVWTGSRGRKGYGAFGGKGASRIAHRMSWILHRGAVPRGLLVCHHCDNPPCIRPEHLFVGTVVDNSDDMMSKGRHRAIRGVQLWSAALTEDNVHTIRRMRKCGVPAKKLAQLFRVTPNSVWNILRRHTWAHV